MFEVGDATHEPSSFLMDGVVIWFMMICTSGQRVLSSCTVQALRSYGSAAADSWAFICSQRSQST